MSGKFRFGFGLFLLFLVVLIWVLSGVLMQFIYTSKTTNFPKPFFLTYVSTSFFSLHLLGFIFLPAWRAEFSMMCKRRGFSFFRISSWKKLESTSEEVEDSSQESSEKDGEKVLRDEENSPLSGEKVGEKSGIPLSMEETFYISFIFCIFWFLANYTFNLSLIYTSLTSSTILSSTSGIFTLLLGTLVPQTKVEEFCLRKLFFVFLCFVGVIFVTFSDSAQQKNGKAQSHHFYGDAISIISAFFYALYLSFLKRKCPHENQINMSWFFGFVGLLNALFLWPLFIFLHLTGVEIFQLPTFPVWNYLCLNSFLGTVLSDYLWFWSTLLTSPLISTLGLSFTMPFSIFFDCVFGRLQFSALFVVGTFFVFIGFLGINLLTFFPQQ
eukprot:Sdes_comp19271_c0_seq2m10272